MKTPSDTQLLVLRYLADQMPAEEREHIDQALITDQDFSDTFAEAANDWRDAYAAGSLPQEWKERVEQTLLAGEDGKASLTLAAGLQARKRIHPLPRNARAKLSPRSWMAVLAPAAAACVIAALWLRSGPSLAPVRPVSSTTASVDAVKHAPAPAPEMPDAATGMAPPINPPHRVLALVMPGGTLRGSDPVPLSLTSTIARVRVQWPLAADQAAKTFTLVVSRDAATPASFAQHGPLQTIGTERVATFLMPAAALPDGESTFALYTGSDVHSSPAAQATVAVTRQASR